MSLYIILLALLGVVAFVAALLTVANVPKEMNTYKNQHRNDPDKEEDNLFIG